MTQIVRPEQLSRVLSSRFDRQRKELLDLVHESALRGVVIVQEEIDKVTPHKPVDTGGYRLSISADLDDHGADVGSDAPHAAVIEYGARPFLAPWRPLYEWALRKFRVELSEQWAAGGKKRGTGRTQRDFRAEGAAAIAAGTIRAILRRGLYPRWVFARATKRMKRDLGVSLANLRNRPGFSSSVGGGP